MHLSRLESVIQYGNHLVAFGHTDNTMLCAGFVMTVPPTKSWMCLMRLWIDLKYPQAMIWREYHKRDIRH